MESAPQATDNFTETIGSIALRYGLRPLFIGSIIFLAFLIFESVLIALAGLGYILVGIPMVLFGCIRLTPFAIHGIRNGQLFSKVNYKILGCLLILMLNFPVAFAYATHGWHVLTCIRVTIRNAGSQPLIGAELSGSGRTESIPPIAAGESQSVWFVPGRDSNLVLRVRRGDLIREHEIIGYITSNMNDRVSVELDDALNAHITRK